MEINPELLAPCGLYCGVCGVYYATFRGAKRCNQCKTPVDLD